MIKCKMCDNEAFEGYYLCKECADKQHIEDEIEDHERRIIALERREKE